MYPQVNRGKIRKNSNWINKTILNRAQQSIVKSFPIPEVLLCGSSEFVSQDYLKVSAGPLMKHPERKSLSFLCNGFNFPTGHEVASSCPSGWVSKIGVFLSHSPLLIYLTRMHLLLPAFPLSSVAPNNVLPSSFLLSILSLCLFNNIPKILSGSTATSTLC